MTKRRKTRAQKAKAAERRAQVVYQPAAQVTKAEEEFKPVEKTQPKAQKSVAPVAKITSTSHPVGLKTSLLILSGLIASQLLLWLLFQFTTIDTQLYDHIKI